MKVLSEQAFIKKIDTAIRNVDHMPTIEVAPNWQLKLSIPAKDQDLGRFLGPNPGEMDPGDYAVFLSEVDALAGTRFSLNWLIDAMRQPGGQ